MNCPSCNSKVLPDERFCSACGAAITPPKPAPVCKACGRKLKPDAAFCAGCGAKFVEDEPETPAAEPENVCPRCGEPIEESQTHCAACGLNTNLPTLCSCCHMLIPAGTSFCLTCAASASTSIPITPEREPEPEEAQPEPPKPPTANKPAEIRPDDRICAKCGAVIRAGFLICMSCGASVSDEAGEAAANISEPPATLATQAEEPPALEADPPASSIESLAPTACPSCGAAIVSGNAFCEECGARLV